MNKQKLTGMKLAGKLTGEKLTGMKLTSLKRYGMKHVWERYFLHWGEKLVGVSFSYQITNLS